MKYDFTTIRERAGHDAMAVDLAEKSPAFKPNDGFDVIPMWVADMNFATAPSVTEALKKRIEHPLYGYFLTSDDYYDSIIRWQEERNGVTGLEKQHIGYENGVLGGVMSALAAVCSTGDKVLVHSPTYIGFTRSLENSGYKIVTSPLKPDRMGVMRMDFFDMEMKIKMNDIRAVIFCSPHNPTGRVWEREELEQFMEMAKRLNVTVISDEIWSDLTLGKNRHIPLQTISDDARERTVALYAPSKTFNLAGLIGSYHIIYNEALHKRIKKVSSLYHYNSINVLSMHALIGAYSKEGAEWVDELREVLTANVKYACRFIRKNFKGVHVQQPEGTYMLFLDCEEYCKETGRTLDEVKNAGFEVGVLWQDGRPFHGPYHIRMNLALPTSRVEEAMERLKKYVFIY
ncbi:MAG: aminotransferase class I/II-fold pyridoxal phosphate-dependent enzyme [Clostridia bacterium]|nr:aminotransferase class I/II-fold pyridoxal phosphate-dependent enzyme [Clostridia bacterium]